MVIKKLKEPGINEGSQVVQKLCAPFIQKAYNSIELLCRELLTEDLYTYEYDKIFLEKNFQGNQVKKMHYLFDRMRGLINLREEAI
jgi:hypothetical protein